MHLTTPCFQAVQGARIKICSRSMDAGWADGLAGTSVGLYGLGGVVAEGVYRMGLQAHGQITGLSRQKEVVVR